MTQTDTGPAGDPFDEAFLASLSRLRFATLRARAREGEGAARQDRRGGRVEFADHRPYTPGDDPRFLDWAAYGRTGRLLVKEFEREEDLSVLVIVDASASMAVSGKFLAAQRLAFALCYLALDGGSRVRAGFCAEGATTLCGEVNGTARIHEPARLLRSATCGGHTRLGESINGLPRAPRGSRVLVLISDLLADDDGREALAVRARAGDDVYVLHLWSPADATLPGGDVVTVEDAETGERFAVGRDAEALARERMTQMEESWRGFAARHRLRYAPLDASAGTEELVLRWLRAGGIVA